MQKLADLCKEHRVGQPDSETTVMVYRATDGFNEHVGSYNECIDENFVGRHHGNGRYIGEIISDSGLGQGYELVSEEGECVFTLTGWNWHVNEDPHNASERASRAGYERGMRDAAVQVLEQTKHSAEGQLLARSLFSTADEKAPVDWLDPEIERLEDLVGGVHDVLWSESHRGEDIEAMARRVKKERDTFLRQARDAMQETRIALVTHELLKSQLRKRVREMAYSPESLLGAEIAGMIKDDREQPQSEPEIAKAASDAVRQEVDRVFIADMSAVQARETRIRETEIRARVAATGASSYRVTSRRSHTDEYDSFLICGEVEWYVDERLCDEDVALIANAPTDLHFLLRVLGEEREKTRELGPLRQALQSIAHDTTEKAIWMTAAHALAPHAIAHEMPRHSMFADGPLPGGRTRHLSRPVIIPPRQGFIVQVAADPKRR